MPTTKYQQHTFVLTSWKNAPSSPILCRITVQLLCKGKPVEIQQHSGPHLRHKAMQSEMYNDQSSFVCQCEELFIFYMFFKRSAYNTIPPGHIDSWHQNQQGPSAVNECHIWYPVSCFRSQIPVYSDLSKRVSLVVSNLYLALMNGDRFIRLYCNCMSQQVCYSVLVETIRTKLE